MSGLVSIIFLIHLVIIQGDNSDKTRKHDQMSIKIESSRNITMQTRQHFTKMAQWLSTLFYANCSAAQVYVLYPPQFIFALSCRPRSFLQLLQSTER